ncbi:MAG: DUF2085 domain-containing protein [Nitrososphaerales archaeon]
MTSQIAICIALAMPVIVDWVTQACGLRESNNSLRLITGFNGGLALAFLSLSPISLIMKVLIVAFMSVGIVVFVSILQFRSSMHLSRQPKHAFQTRFKVRFNCLFLTKKFSLIKHFGLREGDKVD